jgi:hypothetical protein
MHMLPTAIIDLEKGADLCCFALVYQLRLRHACELAIVLLLPLFGINAGKLNFRSESNQHLQKKCVVIFAMNVCEKKYRRPDADKLKPLRRPAQRLRKMPVFFEFSSCLSRACLGNMFVFIYKWRQKGFLFAPRGAATRTFRA